MSKNNTFFRTVDYIDVASSRNKAVIDGILNVSKDTLPVLDFIPTIEGEGIFIGRPRLLVRLSGCALKCVTCDTKFSWSVNGTKKIPATNYDLPTLANKILEYGYNEISITGGEPMHYPQQLINLIYILKTQNPKLFISIETSGAIIDSNVFRCFDSVSLDIKTPSSGIILEQATINSLIACAYMFDNVQLKCVIADTKDLAFIENNFKELLQPPVASRINGLVLTPCADNTNKEVPSTEISAIIEMILDWNKGKSYNIRIIAQQHKLLNYA